MTDVLEDRRLLAITSTTAVPVTTIETNAFTGPVLTFTTNDPGAPNPANYTAQIIWGDLTTSAGTVSLVGGVLTVDGTHTYAEDGTYPIAVTLNDLVDATTVSGASTADVTEFSLSSSGVNFSVPENSPLVDVTVGNFTDPGSPDPASAFTATIDWGDGTTTPGTVVGGAGSYSVTGSHSYADEGTYSVAATLTETLPGPPFSITSNSTATVTEADVFSNGAFAFTTPPVEGIAYSGPVATFDDTGYPGNSAADFSASINWGDGTVTAGTIAATGVPGQFSVSGSHTFLEERTNAFSVTVSDDAPGTATLVISGPLVVADATLTAAPVAVNGTEGAPLTHVDVATFTDADPFGNVGDFLATINWGDGTPVTAGTVVQDAAGVFHVEGSHTYTEENSAGFPVTVSVVDNGGGRAVTDPSNSTATVTSTAVVVQSPLLPVASAVVGTEGGAIAAGTALATFTDTGGAGLLSDYTATVDFGDGSGPVPATVTTSGGGNFSVTSATAHTYAEEGIYAVTVSVTDNDGGAGSSPTTAATTTTATIADAPLTAAATQPTIAGQTEGVPFSGPVSSFNDANPGATAADFSAVIDWGDGSPTSIGSIAVAGGVVTVNGTHTYMQNGAFTVRVSSRDTGGTQVTTADAVVVGDPGLTGATAVPVKAVEDRPTGPITLATFIDPDPNARLQDWNATVDWGDGSPVGTATLEIAGGDPVTGGTIFKVVGSHTYAEEGALSGSPVVTIKDVDNAAAAATVLPLTVTVVDAPIVAQGATVTAVEGVAFTGQLVATFTDADTAATAADFTTGGSIVVNWGDGTTSTLTSTPAVTVTPGGSANGVVFSVFGSHTYAEEGTYQITVTATDAGGSVAIGHGAAVVADARLTASATQPTVNTTEAAAFTGPVGSFTDADTAATASDFTAIIDWGDGTPHTAGAVTQPGGAGTAFVISGTHTYADSMVNGGNGTFPVTVYVVDDGGSRVTVSNTASVADVAIALTGILNPSSDSGVSATDAITNVNRPNFYGTSEPYSHVTLFATPTGGGASFKIGQAAAAGDGSWSITSDRLADGSYTISASAVDQFGKTTTFFFSPAGLVQILPNAGQGPLVIDTVGPRVTDVTFDRLNGQIHVVFRDDRSGLNAATLIDSSNYELTKPHTRPGSYLVTNLGLIGSPSGSPTDPVTETILINGGRRLRGGFYTFTIRDSTRGPSSVQDVAGNSLDGEFYGSFPSGNGVPGGDFVAMLDAFHNKVFAPQTVVGTANAGNGGVGGNPVGAPHGGVFQTTPPRRTVVLTTSRNVAARHVAKAAVSHAPKATVSHAAKATVSYPQGPRWLK